MLHIFIMPHSGTRFIKQIPLMDWAHLHAHLIWIYEGPVTPLYRTGQRAAPYLTAWLMRAGTVEVRVRDMRFKAGAGEWLFPPPGKVWRQFSDDARIISVRYRASWPSGEELFSEGLGVRLKAKDHPELEKTAKPLAAFVRREFPDPGVNLLSTPATLENHLRLQKLFAAWLDASVRALSKAGVVPTRMGHIDARLLRAVQIIEKHTLSSPFAERAVAAQVGLSVCQLNRLFLHQFGVSSRGYYEHRRKEHATAALRSSSRAIKEIAYELGFSSLPHFSAWAKRSFGVAPREYRGRQTA